MATSLLMQGYGGGEKEFEDTDVPDTSKTPFTKWERKSIRETIDRTIDKNANNDRDYIKKLEDKASNGDLNAKEELKVKNVLKDINKVYKPKNIAEHINIVNSDVSKLFSNPKPVKLSNQNILPKQFNISQNFPNPFNPTTTIKYELPKDVKVVIKVYDILGREVVVLVNEFKKAGYYQTEFNGSNFASGVYFYRIEAGEYLKSKKMVLLK